MRKFAEAQRLRPHKPCSKMVEIRGREIRTGPIDEELCAKSGSLGVVLKAGQQIQIRVDFPSSFSSEEKIHVNYREIARLVKPNDLIYIDDGKIVLLVLDCTIDSVACEVKGGGILGGNKNVKLPSGKHEHMPVLTHSD